MQQLSIFIVLLSALNLL